MRERNSLFGERSKVLESDNPLKKYFFVCEGEKTEIIYFNQIRTERSKLGISPLIELVPIIRSYSEEGWSNPEKIVNRLIENLRETESGEYSYETMLNIIMEWLIDSGLLSKNRIPRKVMWSKLGKICKDQYKVGLCEKVSDLEEVFGFILEKLKASNIIDVIVNFQEIAENNKLSYEKNFDIICVIADRDKNSFTEEQYKNVMEKCKEQKFELYITNPCFEFWLLLHFDDVVEIDREQLKENCKVSSKKNFSEKELFERIAYRKNSYDAEWFTDNTDNAIKNAKLFSEDVESLKDEIGSNIGILIQKMRDE